MPVTLPLLDAPHRKALEALRQELLPTLYARVGSYPTRKAIWEALHRAGLFPGGLRSFHTSLKTRGMDGTLDLLFTQDLVDALKSFLTTPDPKEPPRVAVSTLAGQYYCDLQVHLGRTHDVQTHTAELAAGAAGHAAFEADAEVISPEEIAEALDAGKTLELVEHTVGSELEGVRLVGRADRVVLQGRSAKLVLEFKFSAQRELRPTHVVQVEAYGRLLEASGFAVDGLLLAVCVLPRGQAVSEALARAIVAKALEATPRARDTATGRSGMPDPLEGLGPRRVTEEAFTLWVFPHLPGKTARDLTWALSYWTGARAPEATAHPGKCRACPFNAAGLCGEARDAPDGRHRVSRREGPGGVSWRVVPRRKSPG
ncbi:MAG: hypothetical protein HY909_22660 [Deltaproteobacteria bacterium]|nr:hypothetical protein [Deltaproteobacteria bacterium]